MIVRPNINNTNIGFGYPTGSGPMAPYPIDNRGVDDSMFGFSGSSIDIKTIPSPSPFNNGNRFNMITYAPNGFIYGMPGSTTNGQILKINPNTNTASVFGSAIPVALSLVLAQDGNLYSIPHLTAAVVRINTSNDTTTTFGNFGVTANGKFRGGVLAPNGNIYCIPFASTSVGVINPIAQTVSTFGSVGAGTAKYWGGVLAPNGLIYCIPNGEDRVLVINPNNNTTFFIEQSVNALQTSFRSGSATSVKYIGGFLGYDNKIYCIPYTYRNVLVIDPNTNTLEIYSILNDFNVYSSFPNYTLNAPVWGNPTLATNGMAYAATLLLFGIAAGFQGNRPIELNYLNRTTKNVISTSPIPTTFDGTVGTSSPYWGTCLAPNGNIYFSPSASSQILYLTGLPAASPEMYTIPSDLSQLPTSLYNKHSNNK